MNPKNEFKSIVGLFIPVPWDKQTESGETVSVWQPTIGVASIPLGIYMILVAIIINLIMK